MTEDTEPLKAVTQPGMLEHFRHCSSLQGVLDQHALNQVAHLSRQLFLNLFSVPQWLIYDTISKLLDVLALEWDHSTKHRVEANTQTPNIGLLSAELFVAVEDLWGHISRRATLVLHQVRRLLQELRHSKVTYLHYAFIVQ